MIAKGLMRRRRSARGRFPAWLLLPALVALPLVTRASDGPAPDSALAMGADAGPAVTRALEIGAGYGSFSDGYGAAHGVFLRYTQERANRWTWQVEAGSQARFEDSSLDLGVTYARHLPGDATVRIGASTGTGEFIAPRYRGDIAVSRPIVGTLLTVGYTREQSKAENRRDALSAGLERWFTHWIIGATGRYDIGYPGDTVSRSAIAGITYYWWEKIYVGASADFGTVSYMLVEPDRVLVDYDSNEYALGLALWLNRSSGVNLRLHYGETPFYEAGGIDLSFFGRW